MQIFRKDRPLPGGWDLVGPSVKLLHDNIWPIFYLSFLPTLIAIVGLTLSGVQEANNSTNITERESLGVLMAVVAGLWVLLAYPGFLLLQVRAVGGKSVAGWECFKEGLGRLIPFIAMSIIALVLIILGLLLFIIPGLILARGFYLSQYYVVDKKRGPIASLKQSFEDSKPNAGYIWGTIGVELVFALLASFVGYLPVIGPIVSLAVGYIYQFGPALRYAEVTEELPADTAV